MFKTDNVTQRLQSQTAEKEILELSGAVQGNRVEDDVIMNVCSICMCADNKGMLTPSKSHRRFIADLIRFFRCNLSRLEGLADLISQDISFVNSAGNAKILLFGECKFLRCCFSAAGIG